MFLPFRVLAMISPSDGVHIGIYGARRDKIFKNISSTCSEKARVTQTWNSKNSTLLWKGMNVEF